MFLVKRSKLRVLALLLTLIALLSGVRAAAAQTPCGESYTVVYGDTLREIAGRCDISVEAILEANPSVENRNFIYVGQVLQMPEPEGTESYVVERGDTLYNIARRFNTTVPAILSANPEIENPNTIYAGQRLTIPEGEVPEVVVTISPTSGPPGTEVDVTARGLPANATIDLGAGRLNSEYTIIATAESNAEGVLMTAPIAIPEHAEAGEPWVIVVTPQGSPADYVSNTFSVTEGEGAELFERANVYLIALEDAGKSGEEIGCGDSVIPVEVTFEPTVAPLTAALEQLLAIEEEEYGQSGLYNALYRSDLTVESVEIVEGRAEIRLSGTLSVGGVCDAPRIRAQLEKTALQFATVDEVSIFVNGTPLDEVLDQSG